MVAYRFQKLKEVFEMFSQKFLDGRREHLINKLAATKEATRRIGILPAHKKYKVQILIPQIENALKRIDLDSYGICFDCREEIPKKRLLRHPHVERCVPCQTIKEKR